MTTIDAQARLAYARTQTRNTPGTCLGFLYANMGSVPSTGAGSGHYGTAIAGWNYSTEQHAGDMNPPAGAPFYFGASPTRTDANAGAGDVAQSVGGGVLWASDVHGAGVPGLITIAARAIQTARPALGWTSDFLGNELTDLGIIAPPAAPVASGALAVDGNRGPLTIEAEQRALGVTADGVFGPISIRAEQAHVGATVDGIRGPQTITCLQRHLGVTADGIEGPQTISAEQAQLNAGTF